MNRRDFGLVSGVGLLTAAGVIGGYRLIPKLGVADVSSAEHEKEEPTKNESEDKADLVIIGGGLGGCAAALGALRHGKTVIMTEETDWIGGQLTSQAVPPDEHRWIEDPFGCTKSFLDLREMIRTYYRKNYNLVPALKDSPRLNPGNGWVSRLCHEPRVAWEVLKAMLAPYVEKKQLRILLEVVPTKADVDGARVKAVTVKNKAGGSVTLSAPYFIDATELGDLLPLTKTEFVSGSEAKAETQEPSAGVKADPLNVQGFTWCYALEYDPKGEHVIEKPNNYEFWKNFKPQLNPPYNGKFMSMTIGSELFGFDPLNDKAADGKNLWTYRRILHRKAFAGDSVPSDVTIMNWGQNDYFLGPIYGATDEVHQKHLKGSRELSLALLYWLQTEYVRPDGKIGYPGLKLRGDVLGTKDGFAKYPYIRESRRIKAEFTILEHHVRLEDRLRLAKKTMAEAEPFPDSVGVGHYPLDLHPTCGGDNGRGWQTAPFRIPLGSLIPIRMENLLPACKNLGTTHLSNGCYRLHPIEWNIGEAAGALVAYCLEKKQTPREVYKNVPTREDYQKMLEKDGFTLKWPDHVARQGS